MSLADAVAPGATDTSPAPAAEQTATPADAAAQSAGESIARAADGSVEPVGEETPEGEAQAADGKEDKPADKDTAAEKDAEKDKDDPRAKRIARALADMSRRETEMQRREKASKQLAADIAAQRAQIETERKALASQQEELKALARKNPVEAFERLTGMKWDHAIQRIASGEFDKAAPGEDVAELRAQLEADRKAREEERAKAEEDRKAADAEAEQRRAEQIAQHERAAKAACVKVAKARAADFPLVNTYPDEEIAEVSKALYDAEHEAWELANGRPLDFIATLGIMEQRLEEQRDRLSRAKPASPPKPADDSKRSPSETAGTASQQPTTLTNGAASERSELKPAGKPGDFSHLDQAAASMRLWR